MLYQVSDIIKSYLKYEKLTHFDMNQKQVNPRPFFTFAPKAFKLNKLKEIYPEIRRENDFINALKIKDRLVRTFRLEEIISRYLEKLVNELRFEEFLDITYAKHFINSCNVFKNKKVQLC